MKKFLIVSAVLAVAFVALWVDVFSVKCDICGEQAFRTDITSLCCGGHGVVVHAACFIEHDLAQPPQFYIPRTELVGLSPEDTTVPTAGETVPANRDEETTTVSVAASVTADGTTSRADG